MSNFSPKGIAHIDFRGTATALHAAGHLSAYFGAVETHFGAPVAHFIATTGDIYEVEEDIAPFARQYPQITGIWSITTKPIYFYNPTATTPLPLNGNSYAPLHATLPSAILDDKDNAGYSKLQFLDFSFIDAPPRRANILPRVVPFTHTPTPPAQFTGDPTYYNILAFQLASILKRTTVGPQGPSIAPAL